MPWQSHGSCTRFKCNTFNSLHRYETASFFFNCQEGSDLPPIGVFQNVRVLGLLLRFLNECQYKISTIHMYSFTHVLSNPYVRICTVLCPAYTPPRPVYDRPCPAHVHAMSPALFSKCRHCSRPCPVIRSYVIHTFVLCTVPPVSALP